MTLAMAFALSWADILTSFRSYLLYPAWAVLQPLGLMAIFVIFGKLVDIRTDGIPYPLFSFTALIVWGFLSASVQQSGKSIFANSSIIKTVPVPKEIFPLSAILTSLFNISFCLPILCLMLIWYKTALGTNLIWVLPLALLTTILALALGLLTAFAGGLKQDFQILAQFGMQLWMYASPVLYSLNSVPAKWRALYDLNPAVGIIEGFRSVLLLDHPPDMPLLINSCVATVILTIIGWTVYRLTAKYLAELL